MGLEQDIKALVSGLPSVRLALLFGSFGRGEGRSDSDLDLAIAAIYPLTAEEKTVLIENLAVISGRPVDLIDLEAS